MGITTVLMPDLLPESRLMSIWSSSEHAADRKNKNGDRIQIREGIESVADFFGNLHGMHFHASKIALNLRYGDDHRDMRIFRERLLEHEEWTKREATENAFSYLKKYGNVEATSSMAVRIHQRS